MRAGAAGGGGWGRQDVAILAAIGMVEGALRIAAPRDGDIFWGAQSGIDTLQSGIPHVDTYSWSAPGHSWIPSSWGWNVVLGSLYDVFDMAGFLVAALLLGTMLGIVTALVARHVGAKPLPTATAMTVIGAFVLAGTPRATALSTIAAPLILLPVAKTLTGNRREWLRGLASLIVIQIIWINLHSGGLLGPVIVAAFGIGFLAREERQRRRRVVLRLVGIVGALAASCLATPYGWPLIAHAPKVRSASSGLIEEWQHFSLAMLLTPTGIAGALAVGLAVQALLRSRQYDRLLALFVVVVLALSAIRFTPMVLVFVLPEFALALGRLAIRDLFMRAAALVVALGLLAAAIGGLADFGRVEEMWGSPRLVHEIPGGCRLFNDDVSGGSVILLRHDVPVWIDGRNDMYGRVRVSRTIDVLHWKPGSAAWIDRQRVTCALVPEEDAIVQGLSRVPGWRVIDTDSSRSLLVQSAGG